MIDVNYSAVHHLHIVLSIEQAFFSISMLLDFQMMLAWLRTIVKRVLISTHVRTLINDFIIVGFHDVTITKTHKRKN